MKFGLAVPSFCGRIGSLDSPKLENLVSFAQKAEELGFDSLWVVDHLLRAEPLYNIVWHDPTIMLGALAAITRKVKLGPSIFVLPIRSPIIVAKEIASLDNLTGGRTILGVGNGWFDKEFEACGVPLAERGDRTDEYVRIIRRLWTEDAVTFNGRFYRFHDIRLEPKPLQKPHPPIWIAGGSMSNQRNTNIDRVLRRIAKYGDGWISRDDTDFESLEQDWGTIQYFLREYGRSRSALTFAHLTWVYDTERKTESAVREFVSQYLNVPFEQIEKENIIGDGSHIIRKLERLAQIGVEYPIFMTMGSDFELVEFLAKQVLPSF